MENAKNHNKMLTIEQLRNKVDLEIEKLKYTNEPKELYEPINYIMSLKGKRLRPLLTLISCQSFDGDIEKALFPAIAMEMFHNFTLVHDDIMDKADIRRGKTTVHKKWNTNIAILSGDVLFILANQMMLRTEDDVLREVLQLYHKVGLLVCDGQQYDMNFENSLDISTQDYIKMIELKTSCLISGCLRLGAIIAKTSTKNKKLIDEFGMFLGIAFQIEDDILDVYGDVKRFGKKIGGDITTNKKTYLLIKALQLSQGDTYEELIYWLNLKKFDREEKIKAVTAIYDKLRLREDAEKLSLYYYEKALSLLNHMDISKEGKDMIFNFSKLLINRKK